MNIALFGAGLLAGTVLGFWRGWRAAEHPRRTALSYFKQAHAFARHALRYRKQRNEALSKLHAAEAAKHGFKEEALRLKTERDGARAEVGLELLRSISTREERDEARAGRLQCIGEIQELGAEIERLLGRFARPPGEPVTGPLETLQAIERCLVRVFEGKP
jgi:hypothetical protein